MFVSFFYLLRAKGLHVSLNEWLTLTTALDKGLAASSLTRFYYLCRAVLVKSEVDFDKFDGAFLEFFKDIDFTEELPQELLNWLNKPTSPEEDELYGDLMDDSAWRSQEEVWKMFEERLEEQMEEHNGGNRWIGTRGRSNFGNNGFNLHGIRVGGQSRHRRAFQVAGERRFRDFREDEVVDIRSFQMALRSLRQFSNRIDAAKTELDIDDTINETGNNAGNLKLVFDKPRKNTVKLLLMMDSGGSMEDYATLCAALFQAVSKANHFKDLKIYYFHNCIKNYLYTTPRLRRDEAIGTSWVMQNLGSDYKVIIVGDAMMDTYELTSGYYDRGNYQPAPLETLRSFVERYPRLVWITPQKGTYFRSGGYWGQSYHIINKEVDMHSLTIEGLETAIKALMVAR